MLAFLLLDMGMLTARNALQLRGKDRRLVGYGLLAPPVHAAFALAPAAVTGMSADNGALLAALAASCDVPIGCSSVPDLGSWGCRSLQQPSQENG
jgi:hypothetical protein